MSKRFSRGFTLVELMIVVTIIGILAAIAIPKFSNLIGKSKESTVKGSLGAIRSALSIYYGDMDGHYPSDNLNCLVAGGGKYLPLAPELSIPANDYNIGHAGRYSGVMLGLISAAGNDLSDGVSGWLYDNVVGDGYFGYVVVNCTHGDYYGRLWTSF